MHLSIKLSKTFFELIMNYSGNERVRQCVTELAILLNEQSNPSKSDIDRAIRLLRPAKGPTEHIVAIKARIRQSILNHSADNGDAQLELKKFEKSCDEVRKVNPNLLNPFLALLQPLCFSALNKSTTSHLLTTSTKPASQTAFSTEEKLPESAFIPKEKDSSLDAQLPSRRNALENNQDVEAANIIWVSKDTEQALLVDLIYVMQGISGKHIKYDAKTESYIVDPALGLNTSVRDTVLCICELGWLYNRVAGYLQASLANSAGTKGVVVQAFGFALQEELHDYYRLLAVLEQEMQQIKPSQDSGRNSIKPVDLLSVRSSVSTTAEAEKRGGGGSGGTSGLTLLRLKAWLQEPIERMCQMARMVDGALPLRGGALVSRLYAHTQHGDPATRALVQRVLDSVCAPLYTVLSRWILYGELQDPHREFFILQNTKTQDVRSVWRDTYILQCHMLPAYFTHTLAQKILLIGKSINFIRLCLQKLPRISAKEVENDAQKSSKVRKSLRAVNKSKSVGKYGIIQTAEDEGEVEKEVDQCSAGKGVEEEDVGAQLQLMLPNSAEEQQGYAETTSSEKHGRTTTMADVLSGVVTPAVQSALQGLRFGDEATLQDTVFKLSASIDARLLNLVMSRFHIQTHLLALKKFMLLGQGDFVTCLMDGVGPELKRRANQLFRHNLTGILEGALRASNAQFEPTYVQDRVGIRLLEPSPGDSGWEIFSLDYAIDAPLNAVVHMDCLSKYRIAFHMLWRLKRVEWSLTTTWKQHTMFNHTNRAYIPGNLRLIFHRCYLNRAMMMHVVNNLCAFLMFEVLETSWLSLQDTIDSAKCLDDVINAHDAYLSEIMDRALLAPQHEHLNMAIQQLLHIVLRFCSLEETLISDAMAAIARHKITNLGTDDHRTERGVGGGSSQASSPLATASSVGGAASGSKFFPADAVPEHIVSRIDEAVKEYSRQFDSLMLMLKEQGEKAGDILRFLTFRLDFNDYHLQQRAHGGSVGLTSTPPAHLKNTGGRGVNIFSATYSGATATAAATASGMDSTDRLARQGGVQMSSPLRTDSPPAYGFTGPEAWVVPDRSVPEQPSGASKGKTKSDALKYLR